MEPRWIVVTVVIILAILVGAWLLVRRRRSERLRDQFGPEYRRAVHKFGSVTRAESELEARQKRVQRIQTSFVDEPRHAVEEANDLVAQAMKRLAEVFAQERSNLEQQWSRGEDVSTENFRVALKRYRSFFDRLLSV